MSFDKGFQHLLHEVMVAASLQVRDEVEQHKRELLSKARKTNNAAAMPIAYSDSAIYAFRTRVQRAVDCYFQALDDCGILIDADTEREMLKLIGTLTSAVHPLTFPPGLQGPQLSAVQRAHAQETERIGNQLQREAANRLRVAKIRNEKDARAATKPPLVEKATTRIVASSDTKTERTFISYAWETPEHKEWVLAFATTLRHNGVDVILDEWSLPIGEDMYHFMEQSIRMAGFVVIVCTPTYAAKANARVGGVGYEARIITTELAQQTEQRKFIPILRGGEFPSAAPAWLASRRGLDFTATPYSGAEFERLLRTLHREEIEAPPLGQKPVFQNARTIDGSLSPARLSGKAPAHRLALGDELNNAERELLDAAVKDSAGQISHRRPIGPDQLIANRRNFIEPGNPRSAARWKSALESLERKGLIQGTSPEKHFYVVTEEGYELAEQLGPFVRWRTSEVLVQAFYMGGHSPDSISLQCSGVIDVPPVYYEDQYGADGTLLRSIKQRRALLIEGIVLGALDKLDFEPNDLQFADADIQEKHQFRLAGRAQSDNRTLLLEIDD